MITAKEILDKQRYLVRVETDSSVMESAEERAMIEFAKLHVEAALKEASEKATAFSKTSVYGGESIRKRATVSTSSILNAYPLDNIK